MNLFKQLDLTMKLAAIALLGLVIFATYLAVTGWIEGTYTRAEESGAANMRAETAEEGMKRVEIANKAANDVGRDPDVRKSDCMRDARNPENC